MKFRTLAQLKRHLDKLPKDQLKQPLIYNSNGYCLSGLVESVSKAKSTLYSTGDDHPAKLHTRKELLEKGYSKEEINGMDIEVRKGDLILNF